MKCALWLCRRRVFSAEEIPASFDLAALRGYFLAGSLVKWLEDNGGARFAKSLRALSANAPDLNERIEEIFCGSINTNKTSKPASPFAGNNGVNAMGFRPCSSSYSTSYKNFGSAQNGALISSFVKRHGFGSFEFNSSYRGFGSARNKTLLGSFKQQGFGSFIFSTSYKGFGSAQYEQIFGSFADSSFYRMQKLWERVLRWEQPAQGSFSGLFLPEDEYDRIMFLTLAKCPLNRFGYGIHILYD